MLQISELASKEKLPIKFLEQIFSQLKAAGYVVSRRGKFGGYSLAQADEPNQIWRGHSFDRGTTGADPLR